MTDPFAELLTRIGRSLPGDAVVVGADVGDGYSVDWSAEHACRPAAVVKPGSTAEVAHVLGLCHEARQPVVVQGGLTGLAGAATPRSGELALSLERLSGIEELDDDSMTMTVFAGTPLQTIQDAAQEVGLMFPLDMGSRGSCSIGGNIATNAGGNQVIRYGTARSLVSGLEAVLANGIIVTSMNKMLKNNAGYDLKQLFIGTEGTLGVVTRAVLRLFPQTRNAAAALLAISDFDDVIALLKYLQGHFAGAVSSFEVMWAGYFRRAVAVVRGGRSPFDEEADFFVLLEVEQSDADRETEFFETVLFSAMESGLVKDAVIAQSEREVQGFWEIRDAIAELLDQLAPLANFDIGLPISRIPQFLDDVENELTETFGELELLVFGHVGDGNIHIVASTGREEDPARINEIIYRAIGSHHGAVSAEHGIGVLKLDYLKYSRSIREIELMKTLKAALDPYGILNRGRVFSGE
jgi:FAD/FMN-containing dehydrogenase